MTLNHYIMKITNIPHTGLDYKVVFIYFTSGFPRKCIPIKDMTLPSRLFPKATRFIIKCNCTDTTIDFIKKYYPKVNENNEPIRYDFVSDKFSDWKNAEKKIDAIYAPWLLFEGYKNEMSNPKIKFHLDILKSKKPVYVFINDVYCIKFRNFFKVVKESNFIDDKVLEDPDIVMPPYNNVYFMPNEMKFKSNEPWWKDKLRVAEDYDVNVAIIPDNIIYEYPKAETLLEKFKNRTYEKRNGFWCGTCFHSREVYFNKFFKTKNLLDFEIMGLRSSNVNLYFNGRESVNHTDLPEIFNSHDWTIYIARGKFVPILGATFVEPILNGIPIFIDYKVADPGKDLFPGIDCYYSNESELAELVKNSNLKHIWEQQVKVLFT